MTVENRVGKSFESLEKRILYSYVATYPPFKPAGEIPETSQRAMYDFMGETLLAIYENPAIVGAPDAPDDCYTLWALNNSKPELIKAMELIEAKFVGFIENLIVLGKFGSAAGDSLVIPKAEKTVSKALKEKLESIGLTVAQDKTQTVVTCAKHPKLFPAWQAYSRADNEQEQKVTRVIAFLHARYFGKSYRATEFFGALLPDAQRLGRLEAFFEERGFTLSNYDLNNKTRFAYVKWIKEYPDKETASLRASFNWRKDKQLIFEFRVPHFRQLLLEYESMDADVWRMVFKRLKTCDGCGYCTQTDKSGKRERLAREMTCEGETLLKCPLFPGFTWTELTDEDMDAMLRLFTMANA